MSLPSIPDVRTGSSTELMYAVSALADGFDTLKGLKDPLDRVITVRDLVELGLLDPNTLKPPVKDP